jgi:hypothetical protein
MVEAYRDISEICNLLGGKVSLQCIREGSTHRLRSFGARCILVLQYLAVDTVSIYVHICVLCGTPTYHTTPRAELEDKDLLQRSVGEVTQFVVPTLSGIR